MRCFRPGDAAAGGDAPSPFRVVPILLPPQREHNQGPWLSVYMYIKHKLPNVRTPLRPFLLLCNKHRVHDHISEVSEHHSLSHWSGATACAPASRATLKVSVTRGHWHMYREENRPLLEIARPGGGPMTRGRNHKRRGGEGTGDTVDKGLRISGGGTVGLTVERVCPVAGCYKLCGL